MITSLVAVIAGAVLAFAGLVSSKGTGHDVGLGLFGAGLAGLISWYPLRQQESDTSRQKQQLATLRSNVETVGKTTVRTERSVAMARLGTDANHDEVQLPGEQLPRVELPAHSFRRANLSRTIVPTFSNLRAADFTEAKVEDVTMAGILLMGAKFRSCRGDRADFGGAYLMHATFCRASLESARFDEATISGANFCDTRLREASFERVSEPTQADFSVARLHETIWREADMELACFYGAAFTDEGNPGRGSDFSKATKFIGTDFRYANLINCVFADITASSLEEAAGPTLAHALLVGADFSTCETLQHWDLTGAMADASTRWPPGFEPAKAGILMRETMESAAAISWDRERAAAIALRREECGAKCGDA